MDTGFDVMLGRLVEHRGMDATEPELRAMLDGAPPEPAALRRLAPALGLHTADLFAIAAVPVPDDLAPLDPEAGGRVDRLAHVAMRLPPGKRQELHALVASLPREARTKPARLPTGHSHYVTLPGPGAVLMRMLGNRNMSWTAVARTFGRVTGRHWSAATYGQVGLGRKALTADLLTDFATLIDLPDDDLAALTGMTPRPRTTDVTGVAELIWAVRRLTAEQAQYMLGVAEATSGRAASAE